MDNVLYVGSSWAVKSYDIEKPDYQIATTSLYKELNLNAINYAQRGASNDDILNHILDFKKPIKGIIWVYAEPILNLRHEEKILFLNNSDFWNKRKEINSDILHRINDLNVPVGLIGAHSDIFDCEYENIEIIHPSWQKFLGSIAGIEIKNGWGAEVAHRWLVYEFPNSSISKEAVEMISENLDAWTKLELNNLFYIAHPNRRGNILFANEIKSKVNSFIQNI